MSFIGPIVGRTVAGKVAGQAAKKLAVRIVGGIKGAKTVDKVYSEGSAGPISHVKVVPPKKTQAQINEEGLEKARAAIGMPPKGTPQRENFDRQIIAQQNARLLKSRIKRGN